MESADDESDASEYFSAEEDAQAAYAPAWLEGFLVHVSQDGTRWYLPANGGIAEEAQLLRPSARTASHDAG